MADYRFSASVISRGKGQSSVASAAYRAASRLVDERTGEIHNYRRKSGVLHSEIMTPEGTPEWMQDRQQLWSAVEAVESRKNSQLAREIQLSLPHELEPDQRKELVRGFVQEQFVNQGMIADIAIHAPDKDGDQRNHHAHVMLTMRELTGEGFHPKKATEKARSWNDDETLSDWREQWAHHQNRELERYGHEARVDHRSFETQGVDREPSQHLGPVANDMEKSGKRSRIGNENREIDNRNSDRAHDHIQAAKLAAQIAREKSKFENWREYKRSEIENAQKLADLDLSQKHHRQKSRLEAELKETYGAGKATIKVEMETIDRRLQSKGVRKILRNAFGRTRSDKEARREMTATLNDIERRENEQRKTLERRQGLDLRKETKRQQGRRDALDKGITRSRGRREAESWKPRSKHGSKRAIERTGGPERKKTDKSTPIANKKQEKATAATMQPIMPPSNDNKSSRTTKAPDSARHKLDEKRGDLKRPWERSTTPKGPQRPWESNFTRKGKPDRTPE